MSEAAQPSVTAPIDARFGALVADWAIITLLQVAVALLRQRSWGEPDPGAFVAAGSIAFGYRALLHSRAFGGATWGKRLSGLRVVSADGQLPGLGRSSVRAFVRVAPTWAAGVAAVAMVQPGDLFAMQSRALPAVALVLALEVLSVALVLFDTDARRALHDLLAGTRVVRARAVPAPAPPDIAGRAIGLAGLSAAVLVGGWYAIMSGGMAVMRERVTPLEGPRERIAQLSCVEVAQAVRLGVGERRTVQVTVQLASDCPEDESAVAREAARVVLEEAPHLDADTVLSIMISEAGKFPLSFERMRERLEANTLSVAEWRERLDLPTSGP